MFGGLKCHLWTYLERISCYVSTFRSKRCVDVARRDNCRLQQYDYYSGLFYSVVAKTTISNFRQVGTWPLSLAISGSQDHFAGRWLLWIDFFTKKSFNSSTKVQPSSHVISLAVRDRQWNQELLPAKLKIAWRHSNRLMRPICSGRRESFDGEVVAYESGRESVSFICQSILSALSHWEPRPSCIIQSII